jgi:hypothetical protein
MMEWIEQEMATAALGDQRLNRRLCKILERCFARPMASLKAAMSGWAEVVAAYRFFDHEKVTVDNILEPHRAAILERVKPQPRVLVIQDTTEIDYTAKTKLKGSGPLGIDTLRGFFAHTQYVVSAQGLPLGVWHSDIYARTLDPNRPDKQKDRKQRPPEERESYRWVEGYREACKLAEAVPEVEVISQADREGDIYDVFAERERRLEKGQAAPHWLIRCKHTERKLQTPHYESAEEECSGPDGDKLLERVKNSPLLGTRIFEVKRTVKNKKIKGNRKKVTRPARTVTLEVRVAKIELRPPWRKGAKLAPVTIWVVLAQEIDPPADQEAICWILLTSLEVNDLAAASEILDLYLVRWEIEVFHRVLKTGCRVEELQLKKDERIQPAIALYMIVAWRVLYLMKLGRECPDLPCDVVFEREEWQAIVVLVKGREALGPTPPSLREMVRMVAGFGGFLARKHDGEPGAESMWIGLSRLRDFAFCWKTFCPSA